MSKNLIINDVLVELEDYTIQEQIGKGGFGVVFRATDKKTGKDVALKIIMTADNLKTKKDQESLLREVIVPRLLKLPGIVQLVGFRFPLTPDVKEEILKKDPNALKLPITDKGKKNVVDLSGALIITELMKNGSTNTLVSEYLKSDGKKNDKINPTVRSKIIFGVAATMKRVHKSNIIHRDLKLENVFLDDDLEPRIADFGLAKVMTTDVQMTMAIGTPYAMAPEIFMDGEEDYGISVDVYAFAFLIYMMFSNTIQFADKKAIKSPQQFMMKIGRGHRPRRPDSIPDPYWELVQNCWKQHPPERPTFEEITEVLKDDKFAIEEFGMKTDLDKLHEYQERIDKDTEVADLSASSSYVEINHKKFLVSTKNTKISKERKTRFNWYRH